MIRIITIISLIGLCTFVKAQSAVWETANKQEIITAYQSACEWFIKTPSYYFKLRYSSYKDHISKDKLESSEGYYKRVGQNYVTEAVGIKTTQNTNLKIIVDTADKIVTVMNPGNLSPTIANKEELEALLTSTKTLRKIKSLDYVRYRIDFNKNELYEAYEFIINNKGMMSGVIFYYSEQTDLEYNEADNSKDKTFKIKPRLEISFFNFQVPVKSLESEFRLHNVYSNAQGKINLTGIYNDYRLVDYRIQTKK